MRYQFFVFAWPGYFQAASQLQHALQIRGCDVSVIASGADGWDANWTHLDNSAYFGEQFLTSLDAFDSDIFVHIQADALIPDLDHFLRRLKLGHSHPRVGIWAPDVDYTFYRSSIVKMRGQSNRDKARETGLIEVLNTDCTCWSITKPVVDRLMSLNIKESHFGWGWDSIAAAISSDLDLLVLRDEQIKIRHPRGTNYNSVGAESEFAHLLTNLPGAIREKILRDNAEIHHRYNRSTLAIYDKVRRKFSLSREKK